MVTDAFAKSLGRQISDIARLHRNLAAGFLADIGLHPGQEKIIKALAEEDGRTMGDLAMSMGVQAPTVTKMVARLASVGLVERRQGGGDGRQARVYLTDEGRSRADRIDRIWKALDRHTFTGIDAKDRKRLKKLLRRVRENLKTSAAPTLTPAIAAGAGVLLPEEPPIEPLVPAVRLASEEA